MIESRSFSDFEQQVRERAYALWEQEGRPAGRHVEHWRASEQAMHMELSVAAAPRAKKPKAAPRAKPPAPRSARSAAGAAAAAF